jgi:hypothetical protein
VRLGPAQVHPQDHLGPVLRLGAAGAGLDIEIGVIVVHLPREHPAKLESCHLFLELAKVGDYLGRRTLVVFLEREFQQLTRIVQSRFQLVQSDYDLLESRTLLPQRLRALRVVPDVRYLEFPLDLCQALCLAVVVKDTSSTHRRVQ